MKGEEIGDRGLPGAGADSTPSSGYKDMKHKQETPFFILGSP